MELNPTFLLCEIVKKGKQFFLENDILLNS
jgi:hypothetical protein